MGKLTEKFGKKNVVTGITTLALSLGLIISGAIVNSNEDDPYRPSYPSYTSSSRRTSSSSSKRSSSSSSNNEIRLDQSVYTNYGTNTYTFTSNYSGTYYFHFDDMYNISSFYIYDSYGSSQGVSKYSSYYRCYLDSYETYQVMFYASSSYISFYVSQY